MGTYRCTKCNFSVSLDVPKCDCISGFPDLRPSESIGSNVELLYTKIASDDLETSMQPYEAKIERAAFDLARIERETLGKSGLCILEIGPGDGLLSEKLSNRHDLFVADLTDRYISRLEFATGGFIADVETLVLENEFDGIVMCDVLEHVLNEGDALLSVLQALKPGGFLYLRCPGNEPLVAYARKVGSPYPFVHLRTYSRSALLRALETTGFESARSGAVRIAPTGYARRDFGIRSLRAARSWRLLKDLERAHHGMPGSHYERQVDRFFSEVETQWWKVGNRLPGRLFSRLSQRVWYRPSEFFAVGRKPTSETNA